MSKKAFTLAEVLLTLAIIGVVASLTVPAVITKVTQDQYVVGLKKAYNTLKAIEREAVQEHGEIANWDWSGGDKKVFETYFKSHFDILKDCGATTDSGCFHGENETKDLSGNDRSEDYNTGIYYNFITSDGIAYSFWLGSPAPARRAGFTADVNGKKGPNIVGRDVFAFYVFNNAGIKPLGSLFINDENIRITSDDMNAAAGNGCNTAGGNGLFCAAKVLSEGAMNY